MRINPPLSAQARTEEEWNVKLVILSLITGAAVGIIGIYIGYQLYQWALSHFIR
jgi:hypothetical protein